MHQTKTSHGIGALAVASLALASAASLPTDATAQAEPGYNSQGLPLGHRCYKDALAHQWSCYTAAESAPPDAKCYRAGDEYQCYRPSARVTRHAKLPPMFCSPQASDTYICYDQPPVPAPPPPPPQTPVVVPQR